LRAGEKGFLVRAKEDQFTSAPKSPPGIKASDVFGRTKPSPQ